MSRPLAFVVAALSLVAGCVAPGSVEEPAAATVARLVTTHAVSFEDPEGDARERTEAEGTACMFVFCAPSRLGLTDGRPAPLFDVLAVGYEGETAEELRLSLTIADIAEGFAGLDGDGHRVGYYQVCFGPSPEDAPRCARLSASVAGDGVQTAGDLTLYAHECNEWAACAWSIPVDVTFGAPATIRFTVPKAYATWDGTEPKIGWMEGRSGYVRINPAAPSWHTALSVNAPQNFHHHAGGNDEWYTVDVTDPFPAVVAFAPGSGLAPPTVGPIVALPEGNALGDGAIFDRPELDLLAVDMSESDGELVTRFTVREFTEEPDFDYLFVFLFGVEGKDVYEIGYIKEPQNGIYGYAGHCISYECGGDVGGDHEEHGMDEQFSTTVHAEVEYGAPAVITVRTPLETLPHVVAGERTNFAYAISMYADASVWFGKYGDETRFDWHKMSFVDHGWGGAPHVFAEGNAPVDGEHGH